MKIKYFWLGVIVIGAILMILGSAVGSQFYTKLLEQLILGGFISPEFIPLVSAIMVILGYIAFYGGYSVLVAVFLILIKFGRIGKLIITIATGFGLLGLIIYGVSWAVGYFSIPLEPEWQTVLDQVHGLFTFDSGLALAGTAVVVVGKFLFKRAEKAYEDKVEEVMEAEEDEISSESKFCPECGAELPAHANFCNKCGKSFD
ncbi:MAG: zinc ribbon domain-containing protein [Candidatus Hermodarchaeota archaeon]